MQFLNAETTCFQKTYNFGFLKAGTGGPQRSETANKLKVHRLFRAIKLPKSNPRIQFVQ